MNLRDQRILINAGYRLFRLDLELQRIRQATMAGGWGIYGNYETTAATLRAWKQLMKDEKNLEG